jgi:hypothetical protein
MACSLMEDEKDFVFEKERRVKDFGFENEGKEKDLKDIVGRLSERFRSGKEDREFMERL